MMHFWVNVCMSLVTAAMLFGITAGPGFAGPGACLDNRAVQAAIANHQIQSWAVIKSMAGYGKYTDVGAVSVCDIGGTLYFKVPATGPSGESKTLVVNAVTGAN